MLLCLGQTVGIVFAAGVVFLAGFIISKHRTVWWMSVCVISIILICTILIVRKIPTLWFIEPFSWFVSGRKEFIIFSLASAASVGTLVSRLRTKRERMLLNMMLASAILYWIYPSFLQPGLIRDKLLGLETSFQGDVCLQNTGFTCGAASAVTALKQLGIEAQESQLAVYSYTNSTWGVPENLLVKAIEKFYGKDGVSCRYRRFDSTKQLKGNCPTIALVKYALMVDHYVTVMDLGDDYIIIGDPLKGKVWMSLEEFENSWRFTGIVIKRTNNQI